MRLSGLLVFLIRCRSGRSFAPLPALPCPPVSRAAGGRPPHLNVRVCHDLSLAQEKAVHVGRLDLGMAVGVAKLRPKVVHCNQQLVVQVKRGVCKKKGGRGRVRVRGGSVLRAPYNVRLVRSRKDAIAGDGSDGRNAEGNVAAVRHASLCEKEKKGGWGKRRS